MKRASMFSPAPTKKNGATEPVRALRYGKASAVKKDPRLPAMFIVPDTAPEFSFPISTHTDHDGLNVISAPKTANERKKTAKLTLSIYTPATKPIEANAKPIIAGNFLEIEDSFFL